MNLIKTGKLIGLGLVLSGTPYLATLADSQPEDIQQLLVQGHYWVGQGHPDLAIDAWEKVLLTDPENKEARNALQELKSFHPSLIDQKKLALARKLARQHKYTDALQMYKMAFAGGTPNSFYAAEYYETLSGTRGGWKKAVEALKQLTRKYPSNRHYRLVYGRVLTYHDATRRQGLNILEALATNESAKPETRKEATKAWRNGLLWLAGSKHSQPFFKRYLALHPNDQKIINRMKNLGQPSPGTSLEHAYQYLNNGKLNKAAKLFNRLLKQSPDNAEVLAGLGITAMRQKHFASASRYLSKALKIAPEDHRELEQTLHDAEYWAAYKAAEAAYKQGRSAAASQHLKRAEALESGRFESVLLRASIEAQRGNIKRASRYFDQALRLKPHNKAAHEGLIQLLVLSGDEDAAIKLLKKHGISTLEYRRARDRIKATRLRQRALNEPDAKIALLDLAAALKLDPGNAWLRLDLARLLAAQGRQQEADELFVGYLSSFPADTETRYAAAIYYSETGQLSKALAAMQPVPEAEKTEAQIEFEHQLALLQKLQEARRLIAQGNYLKANLIAESMQAMGLQTPAAQLTYAELLARLGQDKDALWIARKAYQQSGHDNPATTLQYATILLLTHQYQALDELLTDLKHHPGLTPSQKTAIADLRLGLELELADNLRKSGDTTLAFQEIAPFLAEYGDRSDVRTLLASIYQDAGDYELALRLYQEEVAHHPGNRTAWAGAVGAALSLQDPELASDLIEKGLEANPVDPELLVQRAQLQYSLGQRSAALKDLQQALGQRPSTTSTSREKTTFHYPVPGTSKNPEVTPVEDSEAWQHDARNLMEKIRAESGSSLAIGSGIRLRDGTPGLDQLSQTVFPMQFQSRLNADKRWGVNLTPTLITAGKIRQNAIQQLGSNTLSGTGHAGNELRDEGLGLATYYSGNRWEADLGLTPSGFLLDNIVGGISWKQQSFSSQWVLGMERRAIKDSVLSYAGLKDIPTNIEWGGVTRNTAHIDYYMRQHRDVPASIQAYATAAKLEGKHVKDNSELELGTSIHWSLGKKRNRRSSLGLSLRYQHFARNLRGFTLGQGGYFSPQQYLALSIPFRLNQRNGALHWGLTASLGIQYFEEDDSSRFPLNDDLQRQIEQRSPNTAQLEGQSKSSFTVGLKAGFEYRLNSDFSVGGLLSSSHDNDYHETRGTLFLQYYFDRPQRLSLHADWLESGPFEQLW